ncbi:hypothetical protein OG342_01325 [Streptomyces bobili]|uniref:hypothetical protein n=1 Tax=Streptomyces bobili TaxID=67280 RepID=UPI00224D2AF2|nr:hypothetical protein [Streptomyces bobili]MCX5521528.1 hypothetical protein [Streptomyces bobili]
MSWFTLESPSAATGTSKADGFTVRTVARICRADFIVIDDLGLLPAELTPIPRNTTGRTWISGHQPGHPRAAHLNIPTAVDIPGRGCRDQGSVHGQWWIDDSRAGIVTGFGRALADAVLRTASGLASRAARRTD